jgi:hypothetical protein
MHVNFENELIWQYEVSWIYATNGEMAGCLRNLRNEENEWTVERKCGQEGGD